MRRLPLFSALLSLLFCVSCAKQKPEAEYRPTTTIKDLMDGVVDPAADTIWNSVATTITIKGKEEKAPHTDEEWVTVRQSAIQLLEASNLLQIPGRHVAKPGQRNEQGIELQPEQIETLINQDRQAWITLAHGLHDAATLALNAADAKDPAKVLESGGIIDNACEHCHQKYWYPHPAQSHAKCAEGDCLKLSYTSLKIKHFSGSESVIKNYFRRLYFYRGIAASQIPSQTIHRLSASAL